MADRDATAPPSASQGASQGTSRSNKRKFKEVYDPSHSELFPEEPWYHLNYRNIIDMVNELLEEIIIGLERYIETDTGIKRLVEDAIKAKNLPDLQKCRVAVLGEQGAGKSTLLTALLGRPLLERSGKGASCTAIPVVLEQKKGAADRTHFSDIRIEWVSREEYAAHIQENIKRWTEVYPGSQDGNGDTEDAAEHDSDGEGSNAEEFAQPGPGSKKIPQTQTGAITAKEFFETIFDANNNAVAKRELEQRLHATDIRQGDFDQLCLTKVTERFQQLNAQLRVKDDVSEFHDVHDRDLGKIRSLADKLWPFVKVFIIATGNMLLRYGMCFFDLPGFGDTNQLRAAHINNFRWEADLELIVADCSRIRTSKTIEKHLTHSIHLKGPQRTILVTNKSDKLIDEDDLAVQIRDLQEPPFPRIYEGLRQIQIRLEELHAKSEDENCIDNEEDDIEKESLSERAEAMLKEGTRAYVEYEKRLVQEHMRDRRITIFSASAKSHLTWQNPMRREDPLLDPVSCGIVIIIRHLLGVPASTNLQNFEDHITKILPAWRKHAGRVLQRHMEDKQYAKMRQDLTETIPRLRHRLEQAVNVRLPQVISQPWNVCEEPAIIEGIKDLLKKEWKHPKILYNGFTRILKENGIPVSGTYFGRNLNEEVLGPLQPAIDDWARRMMKTAEDLAKNVSQPVLDLLNIIRECIETCTAGPLLKEATAEALQDTMSGFETIYNTYLDKLRSSVNENRLRHTTEMDIKCPIAQAMRPSYERALDPQFVLAGKGVYERQRKVLGDSMLRPSQHYPRLSKEEHLKPLVHSLKEQIVSRQTELWKADSAVFITDAIELLESFSQATGDLLTNEEFMTEKYKEAREVLKTLLFQFDRSLLEIRAEFDEIESQHPAKKVKVEEPENVEPAVDLAEPLRQAPDPAPVQEQALVRIG